MPDKPRTEIRLPDYMEAAFERGDSVVIQNEGTFKTRQELLDAFPDRFGHEVEIVEKPITQDVLKTSPAAPLGGKEGQ